MQVVLDGSAGGAARGVRVLSKGAVDEEWTLHAEGRLSPTPLPARSRRRRRSIFPG